MRQIPGGNNRYTSIPKPIPKLIPKKTYNEAHQISSNEDNSIELKNMKEKFIKKTHFLNFSLKS